MSKIEYTCQTIEEIAKDYFHWRKDNQGKPPHMVTFEAYLAAKLEQS